MPQIDSGIRRPAPCGAAHELTQADVNTREDQEAADERCGNDDLAPQVRMAAQLGEVQPMRYRAEPIPESLTAGSPLHNSPGTTRYVNFRARRIVQRKTVQRAVGIEIPLHRPLVVVDSAE